MVPSASGAAAAPTYQQRTVSAAAFVARSIPRDYTVTVASAQAGLDAVVSLTAAGLQRPTTDRIMAAFARSSTAWTDVNGTRLGSRVAELLLTAAVHGDDVRRFGGTDLRAALLRHVLPSGRVVDIGPGALRPGEAATQAVAVLALMRTGGADPSSVSMLARLQCQGQGTTYTGLAAARSCFTRSASARDTVGELSAIAQALAAVAPTSPAVRPLLDATADSIASRQDANGDFDFVADPMYDDEITSEDTADGVQAMAVLGRRDAVNRGRAAVAREQRADGSIRLSSRSPGPDSLFAARTAHALLGLAPVGFLTAGSVRGTALRDLTGPPTAAAGSRVTLIGRATPGASVPVFVRYSGQAQPQRIGSTRASAAGNYAYPLRLRADAVYFSSEGSVDTTQRLVRLSR